MAEKKEGGAAKKDKSSSRLYKNYEIQGGALKRKNQFCPKCGEGIFLAAHKDRKSCGKCNYTEFVKKE